MLIGFYNIMNVQICYKSKTNIMKKIRTKLLMLLTICLIINSIHSQNYCPSKGNLPWEFWISNVQFGTINNTSNKEGYGNFTNQITNAAQGATLPLSILPSYSWAGDPQIATMQWVAWIDWNKNGTFEAAETVGSGNNTTRSINVVVSATASLGNTQLRIAMKIGGVPTACETFERGEVEDYTVNITGTTAELPDLTFTDISAPTTARLNENVAFSCRFKNIGTALASTPSGVYGYVMLVKENAAPIYLTYLDRYRNIVAGLDYDVTFNDKLPSFVEPGNYTLRFVADIDNRIAESNENNNVFDFPITILPATTDNSNLKIISVTGPTLANPNTTLPLSITIKNEGTTSSTTDSIFYATWKRVFFGGGSYPFNYARNRIGVPPIAAGATVTVNANFLLPTTLRTTVVNDFFNIEPYVMLKSRESRVLTSTPLYRDSFSKISYYFPIQPLAATDLSLTGTQLNTTWDSISPNIDISLTVRNTGTTAARNISVNVHDTRVTNNITFFNGSAVDNLVQLSGIGQLSRIFTDVNAGREENGIVYFVWKVPELAAGASVTATFRGKVVGTEGIPQNISFYYNDKTVRPHILYADVRDANKANDSLPILNYRFVRTGANLPDLTLANLTIPTPSVLQGNILNFNFDLKNIGTANAGGSFNVKSYLSLDQTLSADDYQDGSVPTANYTAGLTVAQIAGAMSIRNSLATGQYYLILKADGDNQIGESNENNNIIVSTERITVSQLSGGQCFPVYDLDGFNTVGCERTNTFPTNETGRLQQYSNNIADGFILGVGVAGNTTQLYARNGTTTRPTGARFLNCPANWIYFSAQGGVIRNDARSTNLELNNVLVRVRTYGNVTNPDSISVEIDSSFEAGRFGINVTKLVSVSKRTVCDACWMTDRTPPSYVNCPTTEVEYPLASPTSPFFSRTLTEFFNISATDNCGTPQTPNEYVVPNSFFAEWRRAYDIKYVRFDSAGNKGVCNLRVRMSSPPCSLITTPPFFNYCPKDTTVQAATGQTCAIVNWRIPEAVASTSLQISVRLTSNFTSGTCLPIGTTRVIYTATDSCGNTSTCSFNVTITGATTGGSYCASKSTLPWEYWVGNVSLGTINNTSDKFKDFATLGYSDYTNISTTLNKGQSYPLSITPGLSWIGNVPNAYARVWIDFNQNKTFEANELVLEKTNANPLTANILIPITAVTGAVRMRVALKFGAYPTACETFEKGEVEDYTVNITEGSSVCDNDVTPPVFTSCPQSQIKGYVTGSIAFSWSPSSFVFTDNCGVVSGSYRSKSGTPITNFATIIQIQYNLPANTALPFIDSVFYTVTDARGNSAVCSFELKITGNLPDLTLTSLTIPTPSVLQGQTLSFKVDAKNTGTAAATGNFSIKSYLSTDNVLSANDYQDGVIPTGSYAAGVNILQVPGAMTVNGTVATGNYYLILKIDSDNQIAESNEDNNVIVSTGLVTVTAPTTGGSDMDLSISATPSVYRQWANNTVRISAQNIGNQVFSNVKIEFPFPNKTVTGGSVTPSVGTWKEYCTGNIKCYEWNIPTLAANTTATLDIPLFILDAVGSISGTAKLLAATPADNTAANNSATITLTQSAPTARQAVATVQKPTQLIPIVIQKITPTLTEGDVMIDVESLVSKQMHFYFYNLAGKLARTEVRSVQKGDNRLLFDFYQETQGVYMIQTDLGTGQGAPLKFVKF
jgi:subtilase family serine protease